MSELLKLNNGASAVYEVFETTCGKVAIVNATPHPVTIQDLSGELKSIVNSVIINARVVEEKVSELFVKTTFVGDEEGRDTIDAIQNAWIRKWQVCNKYNNMCSTCMYTDACDIYQDNGGNYVPLEQSAPKLIIVGSIIAAEAYPGEVVAMCPVPGYERVAPSEKRMRCDKFTIF
jgi:hypothetical protein